MQIHQLEAASGLSRDTLRYYEKLGLISPPRRLANGYRDYEAHALQELSFIRKGQSLGFTLAEIKPGIEHLRNPPERCDELIAKLRERKAQLQRSIAQDKLRLAGISSLIRRLANH
jgi:MerR family transcriptional regulator, copper efflux regulator